MVMLASHNRFTSPVHVDAHIVSVVDLVTSLLASTVTIRVGRDFYRMVESQQLVVQSAPLSYAGMYIYFVTSPRGRFNLQPGCLTMLRGGAAAEQVVVTRCCSAQRRAWCSAASRRRWSRLLPPWSSPPPPARRGASSSSLKLLFLFRLQIKILRSDLFFRICSLLLSVTSLSRFFFFFL